MQKFICLFVTVVILMSCSSSVMAAILVFSPNGTYTTKSTLSAAATDADVAGKTVVVTSALSAVQSNISSATLHAWPTDRALKVEKGGLIANTTQFRINYPFDVGEYQVFSGSGTIAGLKTVRPEWWGAKGDGVTSSTDGIQKALACLATNGSAGGTLNFAPGATYKMLTTVSQAFADRAKIVINGNGAILDGTAITGTARTLKLMRLYGTFGSQSLLSASPVAGDTSVSTVTPISFVKGDVALIRSTDLWNPVQAYYYKGEFAYVNSVVGSTINFTSNLYDGYTAATTLCSKLNMPIIEVRNLELQMNDTQKGLALEYVRSPIVKQVTVKGCRDSGIILYYCVGGVVSECISSDCYLNGSGTSYNVNISSCQGTVVTKNNLREARHNITLGGEIPCREVLVEGNVTRGALAELFMSIDMHENTEYCSIIGNTCEGIQIRGRNLSVIGNTVIGGYKASSNALIMIMQCMNSDYYVVRGNTVKGLGNYAIGIWHAFNLSITNLTLGSLDVSDNYISVPNVGFFLRTNDATSTGCTITNLTLSNNNITSSSSFSIALRSTSGAPVTVDNFSIIGGMLTANNVSNLWVETGMVVNTMRLLNARILSSASSGKIVETDGVTRASVIGCSFKGLSTAPYSRSLNFMNSSSVDTYNNTLENLALGWEIDAPGAGTTEFRDAGNRYINSAYIPDITGTVIRQSIAASFGRNIYYSSAAPTTGTALQGDIVYNYNAAVGASKGWVCTVGGTPGTWVSMGNL